MVRDYLSKFLGVPEENTITLMNEMATKAEIDVLVKDRLKGLMGEGDTLYVYYSGHGIPAEETPYLLPFDGDPESPRITAYPVEDPLLLSKKMVVMAAAKGSQLSNFVTIGDGFRFDGSGRKKETQPFSLDSGLKTAGMTNAGKIETEDGH